MQDGCAKVKMNKTCSIKSVNNTVKLDVWMAHLTETQKRKSTTVSSKIRFIQFSFHPEDHVTFGLAVGADEEVFGSSLAVA